MYVYQEKKLGVRVKKERKQEGETVMETSAGQHVHVQG